MSNPGFLFAGFALAWALAFAYLWLLSRTPEVSEELVERFVSRSSELGFDTDNLIFVDHAD